MKTLIKISLIMVCFSACNPEQKINPSPPKELDDYAKQYHKMVAWAKTATQKQRDARKDELGGGWYFIQVKGPADITVDGKLFKNCTDIFARQRFINFVSDGTIVDGREFDFVFDGVHYWIAPQTQGRSQTTAEIMQWQNVRTSSKPTDEKYY